MRTHDRMPPPRLSTADFRLHVLGLVVLAIALRPAVTRAAERLDLATLSTGATVSFVREIGESWGITIEGGGTPRFHQPNPARIEVYRGFTNAPAAGNQRNRSRAWEGTGESADMAVGDQLRPADDRIHVLVAGYDTVERSAEGIVARAKLVFGEELAFEVHDRWKADENVINVLRTIEVNAEAPGGFESSIVFSVDPAVAWGDVNCLAPGALYGDPTYDGERSAGGTLNHAARRFLMREDILPAPLFALSFKNGSSVSVLDPSPRGDSTVAETRLAEPVMIDGRFRFGALGAWQIEDRPIEFGFRYPGTACLYPPGRGGVAEPTWYRRYHPARPTTVHRYEVSFRFGADESFPVLTRNAWRWAWKTLDPTVSPIDVEQMRRVLIDHLAAQATTIDGRTAIPFVLSTIVDQRQWNSTMVAMGFVGKTVECADQLLREGDRDPGERGNEMRRLGLAIIASLIEALPDVPLEGTGYDLATGEPWDHIWLAPWLRNATEDMRVLVRAYQRERDTGRDHPEWFAWVKHYVDWLLGQQRADGSFPRRWKVGSDEVAEPSGTTSYCPVPLLVLMAQETGDPRYQEAAIRAAEYVWDQWGVRGLFIGGASDNPNITDKEAGMLSLEAFLSLYESTGDAKWLQRAQTAADFTETWMWIWNLPMPVDADDASLRWKQGVSTIGPQGITALNSGSVDQYLDWSAASFARLYRYTRDTHYLEVARILLHGTKAMVALPGRQYDLKGIGWQQEGWRFGPGGSGRGTSGHRFWLPWISANHLYSITGLEELDPALFRELCAPTSGPRLAGVVRLPNALRLTFTHAVGGLVLRGGRGLESFFVRDEQGTWHRAHAKLVDGTVVVSSSAVLFPTAVRYAPEPEASATLQNNAGLPAAPFEAEVPR